MPPVRRDHIVDQRIALLVCQRRGSGGQCAETGFKLSEVDQRSGSDSATKLRHMTVMLHSSKILGNTLIQPKRAVAASQLEDNHMGIFMIQYPANRRRYLV